MMRLSRASSQQEPLKAGRWVEDLRAAHPDSRRRTPAASVAQAAPRSTVKLNGARRNGLTIPEGISTLAR